MRRLPLLALCLLPLASLLSACGDAVDEDLSTWMTEQRAQARTRVPPLSPPKEFTPADYLQGGAVDPFSAEKLTQALQRDTKRSASDTVLLAPELARRKEPLEAYPLDGLTMVGSLQKDGRPAALIKVGTLLYQVRIGEHLGQNFGRITSITETETRIREVVQDPGGDWIERNTSLQLQEITK
ncbi:pilus assembly protein PilP [Xylophilus rhododendri]|uniref:Pilus assembly protein PilP n=1 Tax=Xylophilus rhododendri TaxID=2697032 RepID=A0A857J2R2_9BURK|nr:pilus assembly protein PilP [Xylophilus rhododendri]QHI98220.1 pilus assembly protein PilP [Xylophilus rhododendri]